MPQKARSGGTISALMLGKGRNNSEGGTDREELGDQQIGVFNFCFS